MERLEQHVGTIMQIMVIGLLGWSLKTNVDMRAEIGILQAKVEAMQTTINQGTNDRYRGSDAARDFAAVWAELQRQNSRVNQLEERNRR
jgi:hypothetical protein